MVEVPAWGPLDAPLMWVGEAPGRQEERKGRPFVGSSGWMARDALRVAGVDPEHAVLWANAIPINPGDFPEGMRGALLLKAWAKRLDGVMEQATPRVVVACGGVALQRLTGLTSIGDWCGSVLRNEDVPDVLVWHRTKRDVIAHPVTLPQGVVIVPVLHPAGILRDPTRGELRRFQRDVAKAAKWAMGEVRAQALTTHFNPHPMEVVEAFEGAERVYFDTEFNPETGRVFWVGMAREPWEVWGMPWAPHYYDVIKRVLGDERSVKGAHNALADVRALRGVGVEVRGRVVDTMVWQYCLHPGSEVGLSPTSRWHLTDVMHRKWMDTGDPLYNAYDVAYGEASWVGQEGETAARAPAFAQEVEVRFKLLPVAQLMEDRGMLVDREEQKALIAAERVKVEGHQREVQRVVGPMWDERVRKEREKLHVAMMKRREVKAERGECKKHKWAGVGRTPQGCEACAVTAESVEVPRRVREYVAAMRDARETRHNIKKWESGFNAKSNEHLGWFLYSAEALRLPIQRARKTKRVTTSKQAIEKLSKLKSVKQRGEKWDVVAAIKHIQECEKAMSTFLDVPLDERGYAHPPYKIHGTVTGRLAGGEDKKGELDKVNGEMAFNAMNIPREWRRMYVAPPGQMLVAVDVSNQEGRCAAWYAQDASYLAQFEEELRGGPKVHALNTALVYGIDPADAKKVMVRFKGGEHRAYDAGKAATHSWTYSLMPVRTLMGNYELELEEAIRIDDVLSAARPRIVEWKRELVERVLGTYEAVYATSHGRAYGQGRWEAHERSMGCRRLANAFGWELEFMGVGEVKEDARTGEKVAVPVQANEVLAFLPQSTGASTWARCAREVHDECVQRGWMGVWTGTYDSLVVAVPDGVRERDEAREMMTRIFTQKWEQMGGYWFPVEAKWGYNWGDRRVGEGGSISNEQGLRGEW